MDQNMDNPNPTPENQPPQPEPAAPEQPPVTPPPPIEATGDLSKDAKQWAMFCHLGGLVGFLPVIPFPIGNVLGPLVLWLIKKDDMAFVDEQGKEALNFQISMSIYTLICIPLVCLGGLGAILAGIVAIVDLVFIIIASIAANKGENYRYPLCIRLIK